MQDDGDIRVGSAEREEALAALAEHHAAGRLDANDYEDRRGRATDAVVRRDLTSLFTDLPEPRPRLEGATGEGTGRNVARPATARSSTRNKVARTLVSLSPFIALVAFFRTDTWLVFLLIPIIAILARAIDD
jgi:hypothetical protein